jgi:hypothetical protein
MQNVTSVSMECVLGCQKVNQKRSGCPTSIIKDADGAAVADESDDDGVFRMGAELGLLQDVDQESGEERARAERDHAEIEKNPQAEGEAVVHVGLVQAQYRHKPAA